MTYANKQDLVDRAGDLEISQIADRDGTEATMTAAVNAALDAADKRIDAVLAIRFTLPLSQTPAVVKQMAVSIARYLLHRDGAPEHVRNDYKEAIADLDRVTAGKLSVPGATGLLPQTGGDNGSISYTSSPSQFSPENIEGWS
jgi:phage gp36-like protein